MYWMYVFVCIEHVCVHCVESNAGDGLDVAIMSGLPGHNKLLSTFVCQRDASGNN